MAKRKLPSYKIKTKIKKINAISLSVKINLYFLPFFLHLTTALVVFQLNKHVNINEKGAYRMVMYKHQKGDYSGLL